MDDPLRIAGYVLYATLALLAVLVARRDRDHRAFAAFAVWMPATDWIRIPLRALRAGTPDPEAGLGRLLHHVGQGLVLSWSFTFLAVVLLGFTRIRAWPALLGWVVAMAVCLNHSVVRGDVFAAVYKTASVSCMGLGLLAVAWALVVRHDLQPKLHHLCIMVFLAGDIVTFLFPFVSNLFTDWPVVRAINVVVSTVLCALHAQALLRPVHVASARRLP